jgi:peptidoglycan hydrolase CwlO-like protein
MHHAEIEQLNEQIRVNNGTIRDREVLLKSRVRKLADLKKNKTTGLTVEELARHNA